jgi:hypothetical protein
MEHGTGWVGGLEPTPELVRASAAHLEIALGGALVRGLEGGLERDPWVQTQGHEESCAPRMGIGHIYGLTGIKCSPYIPWWAARVSDAGSEDISNVGVSTHSFVRALREHGACDWEKWNSSSPGFDMNKKPPALARIGAQKHNLDMVPIYAFGTDAIEAACEALDHQFPVGVVVNVDDAYSIPGFGGVVGPERGKLKGQHGVTVWRYRTADSGRREFLSPGSWGTNFGDHGLTWLDESRIANTVFLCFSQGVS